MNQPLSNTNNESFHAGMAEPAPRKNFHNPVTAGGLRYRIPPAFFRLFYLPRLLHHYKGLFASICRTKSSILLEYPHSLSYQLITLTVVPMTLVERASTIDECGSP